MKTVDAPLAGPRVLSGLCTVAVVAATYVFFLLFAEFAFVELTAKGAGPALPLRVLMGWLGVGGLAGSLGAAALFRQHRFRPLLCASFLACGLAAVLSTSPLSPLRQGLLAAYVGLCTGFLTVTLAGGLGTLLHRGRAGLQVGFGTGLAYAFCNVPSVFSAPPSFQAWLSAFVAFAGALSVAGLRPGPATVSQDHEYKRAACVRWILVLGLLIWLDSAAFFVIQHEADLLGHTWAGAPVLWSNAFTHFAAAVVAGLLLDRGWRRRLPLLAYAGLAGACVLLALDRGFGLARFLYTGGVSLYSTLLVWHAALSGRRWFVGLLFALAGWIGSALGIGMAQDLLAVPLWFVAVAGLLLLLVFLRPARSAVLVVCLLGLGGAGIPSLRAAEDEAVLRGREVYIAEGCIHCHSQYVRPGVPLDVERWGPASEVGRLKGQEPPLPGNRRQGPDLANVGNRRSPEWNRLHLVDPQVLMPRSRMPGYPHLFRAGETRGEDLLVYLASLGAGTQKERQAFIAAWQPAKGVQPARFSDGRRLYAALCQSCHGSDGRGDGVLASKLIANPADLLRRPLLFVQCDPDGRPSRDSLLRVIKFGLPNGAMAGHEYLPDDELLALADYVESLALRKH